MPTCHSSGCYITASKLSFRRNLVNVCTNECMLTKVNIFTGRNMMSGNYYVYITTNPSKTVLYTGVTNDLRRRIIEHYRNKGKQNTFAGKYYCYKLIYYEYFTDINQAIQREKEIKDMSREKKEELISLQNPKFNTIMI